MIFVEVCRKPCKSRVPWKLAGVMALLAFGPCNSFDGQKLDSSKSDSGCLQYIPTLCKCKTRQMRSCCNCLRIAAPRPENFGFFCQNVYDTNSQLFAPLDMKGEGFEALISDGIPFQ
eukprot:scaffold360_cov374-Pavlova_lutheri.AAC.70